MVSTKLAVYVVGVVLVGGALLWVKNYRTNQREMAKNFQPIYITPAGWIPEPHGPTTLFKLADPKTKLVLKGAVNQVISDTNPTPDLDTDGIAQFYVDRTKESMPDWTATTLGNYKGTNTVFDVVERSTKDRTVITAYAVKGNTTLLITLFGIGKAKGIIDDNKDKLYSFLNTVSLKEQDMSSL